MGLFETLATWDKSWFLSINNLHSNWMDHFMWLMSETIVWLPFFLLFIYQLIKNRKVGSLFILLTFALLIAFTDQVASSVFKPLVCRLRPTHDPDLANLVHIVHNYKGGHYGFFSSHAANVFAFAGLSLLFVRNWIYSVCIILWAALISYSRIYLGVHFPLDILSGAIFGILSSYGFYYLYITITKDKTGKLSGKGARRRKSSDGFPLTQVNHLTILLAIVLSVCLLSSYYLSW